jgi:hypothetical protein
MKTDGGFLFNGKSRCEADLMKAISGLAMNLNAQKMLVKFFTTRHFTALRSMAV